MQLVRAARLYGGVPYAYASIAGPGALVFTAGACPLDENEAVVGAGDVRRQAQQVMANLSEALAAAGATLTDVLKTTVYAASADRGDLLAAWDAVRAAFGKHDPPSTLLGVTTLGYRDQLVEVEAAASFAVAARENGFTDSDARTAARLTVRSYRTEIANYAAMRFLKVWYSKIDIDEVSRLFDAVQSKAAVRRRRRDIAKAQRRASLRAFRKMCDQVEGQYRIRPAHPVIVRFPIELYPDMLEDLRSAVARYQQTLDADRREVLRRYYFGDFARKVVGVGSVGTEAFAMLLIGDRPDEPLFLQLKEAQQSVLARFAGASAHYYGRLGGWALARAHARTGRAAMISGYLGTSEVFDQAIADFAIAHASQNLQDYQRLLEAVSAGRVLATIELRRHVGGQRDSRR